MTVERLRQLYHRSTLVKWYLCLIGTILQVSKAFQIIVHAPPKATDVLIDSCGTIRAMTKDIYAPAAGESIQIGQQTNTFSISLSDELMKSIKMSSVSSVLILHTNQSHDNCSSRTTRLAL